MKKLLLLLITGSSISLMGMEKHIIPIQTAPSFKAPPEFAPEHPQPIALPTIFPPPPPLYQQPSAPRVSIQQAVPPARPYSKCNLEYICCITCRCTDAGDSCYPECDTEKACDRCTSCFTLSFYIPVGTVCAAGLSAFGILGCACAFTRDTLCLPCDMREHPPQCYPKTKENIDCVHKELTLCRNDYCPDQEADQQS